MDALALLFKKTKSASIDVMMLDASIDETHESFAEPTQNEVEEGVDVADHVKLKNTKLSITGVISSTPITAFGVFTSMAATGVGQLGAMSGTPLLGLGASVGAGYGAKALAGSLGPKVKSPPRTVEDCYYFLEEKRKARRPFTVITGLRKYDDMILTSLKVPRNKLIGRSLEFTATFEQIRTVSSSSFLVAQRASVPQVNNNPVAKLGNKVTGIPAASTAQKSSILLSGIKAVVDKISRLLGTTP